MCAAFASRNGQIRHWKGSKVQTKHFTLLTYWSKHINTAQDCSVQIVQICFEMLNWVKFAPELYMSGRILLEGPKIDFELMHSPPSFDYVKPFEPRVSNWLAHAMKESSVRCKMAQQSWFNAKNNSLDLRWNATSASVAAYAKRSTIEEARGSHFSTTCKAEGLDVNIGTSQVLIWKYGHDRSWNRPCYQHEIVS